MMPATVKEQQLLEDELKARAEMWRSIADLLEQARTLLAIVAKKEGASR
jgi:hypothetical protein